MSDNARDPAFVLKDQGPIFGLRGAGQFLFNDVDAILFVRRAWLRRLILVFIRGQGDGAER